MNKPEPKIRAVERPMRIAYVLEHGDDSHRWLDSIFAECFSRHGGRHSLIVPYGNSVISERYLAWIKAIDPDCVVLLTYQNREVAQTLSAVLGDCVFEQRTRVRGKVEDFPRVRGEGMALTSLSWIPFFQTVSGMQQHAVERILDQYPAWPDDGLIKDNFGTLHGSIPRYPMHEHIGVRPLILTPENPPENRWRFGVVDAEEISDAYSALTRIAHRGVATLAQMSNLNCQRFTHDHPWRDKFCLVIGDSLEDRIVCWNAGLLFDDATSQRYKTLRVPSTVLDDPESAERVAEFLRAVNWLGSNSGPSKIAVRSYSLDANVLTDFITRTQQQARSVVTFERVGTLDDCCPEQSSSFNKTYNTMLPASIATEVLAREAPAVINAPVPHHLRYCAGKHPAFSQGNWYVDLVIDKLNDHGRFSNIREAWKIPLRRQLIRQFVRVERSRILSSNDLSVPVSADAALIEITQPDDESFFHCLITDPGYREPSDILFERDKVATYRYAEPSDKGRYLAGLLGMFGSLYNVESVMNTRFWRRQLYGMAAPATDQRAEVKTLLQKRLKAKAGLLVIENDEGWARLAECVIQNASRLKVPRLRTRFDWLLKQWEEELNEAIEADEHLRRQADEIVRDASNELKRSLAFLVGQRIFYRGHEWVCRTCSHRNWTNLRSLDDEMSCEVCEAVHRLPVDVAMDFRLNEFLATCLREHDTFTVACILASIRRQSKLFFTFAPQTSIFKKYPEEQGGSPSRELDILCISDGRFIIGEAKARAELIAPSDIKDLAEAAVDLQVDMAVLAVLSDERSVMPDKLAQLRELLPESIAVQMIVAGWDDEPSSYL